MLHVDMVLATHGRSADSLGDDQIRQILVDRVDVRRQSVGIVVGIRAPSTSRVIAHGCFGRDDARPVAGDTIFEIASLTKVFTAMLLADMATRGEVALTDPVSVYLPGTVDVPRRGDRQITLLDLATHTSGLPRLPTNFTSREPSNPYADYDSKQLYAFLSTYELTRDIGAKYQYSNLGYGLLGDALARRASVDYGELVHARIFEPLRLKNTSVQLTNLQRAQLATGHNDRLEPVPGWDYAALEGAGAIKSTANDQLRFLAAALQHVETPLAPAIAMMLTIRRPTPTPGLEAALGWHVLRREDQEIVMQSGMTGGYSSFLGYRPSSGIGVVVLSNAMNLSGPLTGIDDIGMHLLDPRVPLNRVPKQRRPLVIDRTRLDAYVGEYRLGPESHATITREGDRLFMQITDRLKTAIIPESEDRFFTSIGGADVTFVRAADGTPSELHVQDGAVEKTAMRVFGGDQRR